MNSGDTISRYQITRLLGKGGMGVVYEAEDTRLQRPVALKFLPPDSLLPADRERFFNEARAAARIRHPNVCPIYDVEEAEDRIFIAMACLQGETLSKRIARGPLEIPQAVHIALQIAKGLEAAHELGIVHRDIKSSNIFIGPDGHASILDFGLAILPGAARLTAAGHATGTPAYMSPEQARGQVVDKRTDIWSLGVLLFEMVTGVLPFRNANPFAVTHSIISEKPPSVSSLRPNVPPGLEHVISKALAKPPERRWQSARDMAAPLQRLEQQTAVAETQTLKSTNLVPAQWHRRRITIALLAIVPLGFAAGAWYVRSQGRPQPPSMPPILRAAPGSKQLALLPFQVPRSEDKVRIVADGLMEVLTDALSDFDRFQGKIVPVPASEIRRREISSVAEARRIYGVDLAIEGSAQSKGNRIRFNLQLFDAAANQRIATSAFEYDPQAPGDAKNRAITEVARLLQLNPKPAARAENATPDSYSAYLEGRGFLSRYDVRGNVEKSISSFRRAVDLDPKFALAWAGLGGAYWRKARTVGDKESAALARESAERAVKLDPGVAIVHSVLGTIYGATGHEQEAIRELQIAMQVSPGNAEAPRELAQIYSKLGRLKEAETSYLQAVQTRPTDWYGHLLLGLFYNDHERYKEAEAAFKRSQELAPDNEIISRNLGNVYLIQGRYVDALEVLQKSLKIRSNARTYLTLSAAYFYQHRFQEAASAIETAIDLDPSFYEYWGDMGAYYKWVPGSEARVAPALHRAIDLAEKRLEVTPTAYEIRAALAEYRARLGDSKGALAEIDRIPSTSRQALAIRMAVAYELTGNRGKAIELIRLTLTNPASLNQIKNDPDLASLWADPLFQSSLRR